MNKSFNPLALFGLLGLFGFIGPITGKFTAYGWFAWFLWFANYNKPTDERFFRNLSKTGLVCFAIAMLGLTVAVFMKNLSLPMDMIYTIIEILFTVLILAFVFMMKYFEDHGEEIG